MARNRRDTLGTGMATDDATATDGTTKLVCFFLHGQEYAADITDIKETMLVRPITPVFLTPAWIAGIINVRGDVVAVIDLAQLLSLPPISLTDDSRIVIARCDGKIAGVMADRMAELRTIDLDELQPPPPTLAAESAALLRGVATVENGAALRVLDMSALFESERMTAFQRQA